MSSTLRSSDKQLFGEDKHTLGDETHPLGTEADAILEAETETPVGGADDQTATASAGFQFDTETEHHDPVMRLTAAYEQGKLDAELLEAADTAALKRFVVRAETGEFDVRSNPALEATVRIARSLIYDRCR